MKNILITGSRSGIINKTIEYLKDKDVNLFVTTHTDEQLNVVKRKYINNHNIRCFKLDVTYKQDVSKLNNLDIDVLVINGGIAESGSMAEINLEKVRNNFEVNVFGNLNVIQHVIKNMIKKGKGKIIVISSLAGEIPLPFLGAYSASKAALTKLSLALHYELKLLQEKIDVCIFEPGLYRTGFNRLAFDKKYDWMDNESFFKAHIDFIKKSENVYLFLFERRKLTTISKKIAKVIMQDKVKTIYRIPFTHALFTKLYNLFN